MHRSFLSPADAPGWKLVTLHTKLELLDTLPYSSLLALAKLDLFGEKIEDLYEKGCKCDIFTFSTVLHMVYNNPTGKLAQMVIDAVDGVIALSTNSID